MTRQSPQGSRIGIFKQLGISSDKVTFKKSLTCVCRTMPVWLFLHCATNKFPFAPNVSSSYSPVLWGVQNRNPLAQMAVHPLFFLNSLRILNYHVEQGKTILQPLWPHTAGLALVKWGLPLAQMGMEHRSNAGSVFVHFTKGRAIWERGTLIGKMPPSECPVNKLVKHFLD